MIYYHRCDIITLDFYLYLIHFTPVNMIKRDILAKIMPWVGKEKILVLKGSRQVGKTTLLRQIESEIIRHQQKAVVAYLSADDLDNRRFFQSPDALELYLRQRYGFPDNFIYLMIDEFQAILNAGIFLKNLFDRDKKNVQFIVSGSSSLEITKNTEFLTGRALNFMIERVSFFEYFKYIQSLDIDVLSIGQERELRLFYETYLQKLEMSFSEYLKFGGYPEVITTQAIDDKKLILSSISKTYIEKDIINFLKVENVSGFNSLLKLLVEQSGKLVNKNELSNTLSMSINTVKKYADFLSGTYVVNFLKPFSGNLRTEITKMPKVYILDLGLRNYLLDSWNSETVSGDGDVVENFVYLTFLARRDAESIRFYRTIGGAEIDFLLEEDDGSLTSCEVKYREKISGIPAAMKNAKERYPKKIKRQVIITKRTLLIDKDVWFIPAVLLPFVKW